MTARKTGHRKGLDAETIAALYLRCKGYRILERRFRTPKGEIDIIAKRGGAVAFVEVKLRKTHEDAAEAVHRINQERVRQAAALYLMRHTEYTMLETRFDALVMAPGKLPQHIVNAF
ncbi:MAG: YraN family protein [Alphaproteobacteria bacterium]|nr:MAG: YraN family protein [Alphaproteobacteria bacterium]